MIGGGFKCRRSCRAHMWGRVGWDAPVGTVAKCGHGAWWRLVQLRGKTWGPNPPTTWVRVPSVFNRMGDTI